MSKNLEVKFFYVEYDKIKDLPILEQVNYFLDKIEKGYVVIVDSAIDPVVGMKLTETILSKIQENPEVFKGIEYLTIEKSESKSFISGLIKKFKKKQEGITIIGPSNIIKKIERDGNLINMKF